jgi:hypothetical protein
MEKYVNVEIADARDLWLMIKGRMFWSFISGPEIKFISKNFFK